MTTKPQSGTPRTDAVSANAAPAAAYIISLQNHARQLERELNEARDTNSRLNRRNQGLQSDIKQNRFYSIGFRSGCDAQGEHEKKKFELKLADYKAATRKEFDQLRARIAELEKDKVT